MSACSAPNLFWRERRRDSWLFAGCYDFTMQPFPRRSMQSTNHMTSSDSSDQSNLFFQVAIPTPLRRLFDYLPPESDVVQPQIGTRVRVPFGRREVVGMVMGTSNSSVVDSQRLRPITSVLDNDPLLSPSLLEALVWAGNYYQHPCGEVIATALPAKLRKGDPVEKVTERWRISDPQSLDVQIEGFGRAKRQRELFLHIAHQKSACQQELQAAGFDRALIRKLADTGLISPDDSPTEVGDSFKASVIEADDAIKLNEGQSAALSRLAQSQGFNCFLIDGVTGSGKTEIYLQAMAEQLKAGKQCLLLVPEIGLTPQTIQRIETRFSCPLVVLHSGLTDTERLQAWQAARTGQAGIIIGTRSAVFTPLSRPGIIIIDEEHDASFKQQDGFRYSARDVAIKRAQLENITIVLGSATPSLESLRNSTSGKSERLVLEYRAGIAKPPAMSIADISVAQLDHGFSEQLLHKIGQHLAADNQVLIFINRRGYAPVLQCEACTWISECAQCIAQMTVHARPPSLRCHHCGSIEDLPRACPACGSTRLHTMGAGTQKLEQFLQQRFSEYPVLRIDRDSTRNKNSLARLLHQVQEGRPCLLLGTQMLAKGHHFPDVTLVVVLDADLGLFSADFRGQEHMAQTIVQVAGRAGRSDKEGEVVIQSRHGSHPTLIQLIESSYQEFSQHLLLERETAQMPPYSHLALLQLEATQQATAQAAALSIAEQAAVIDSSAIEILGPVPAPMEKRAGRYRMHLLYKSVNRAALQNYLRQLCLLIEDSRLSRRIRWSLDVDPSDMI